MRQRAIYEIRNRVNNRIYIGVTQRGLESRWKAHYYLLNRNTHPNHALQGDWNNFGESSFETKIIKRCRSAKELFECEARFIRESKNCYNLQNSGTLTNSEYDWFAEQAQKVGATIQGFVAAQLKEIYQRANTSDNGR